MAQIPLPICHPSDAASIAPRTTARLRRVQRPPRPYLFSSQPVTPLSPACITAPLPPPSRSLPQVPDIRACLHTLPFFLPHPPCSHQLRVIPAPLLRHWPKHSNLSLERDSGPRPLCPLQAFTGHGCLFWDACVPADCQPCIQALEIFFPLPPPNRPRTLTPRSSASSRTSLPIFSFLDLARSQLPSSSSPSPPPKPLVVLFKPTVCCLSATPSSLLALAIVRLPHRIRLHPP